MKNVKKKTSRITAPHLWIVIMRSQHAVRLLLERGIASKLGLTDFAALEALLHKGPLTITQIQEKVLLATGSMTAAIDRLEKHGLIVRKSSPRDRRARLIALTPKGRQVAAASFAQHARELEELMSVLSEREKRQVYEALKKVGMSAARKLNEA
ncbi:MAG: MarR family transcriptional regulator [Acidobacteriota bacterium]|nr:MarR family transcriptional regulator [Acidobacteriota bacterium]